MKRISLIVFLLMGLMASSASATSDWTGAVNNDWANGNNWSDAPGGPDSVERRDIANNGPTDACAPVVSANSTAGVIHMGRTNTAQTLANATLTVSAGTLTVTSAGSELVSVAYGNVTNNLTVDGGNLVVYNPTIPGTGEIRLQHAENAACIGYVNLWSGSIDTERLNLGSRAGLGKFTATGGTLTIRDRIDRFGLVATNVAYGFRLGGATLELSGYADRENDTFGNVSVGAGADTDFIMENASKIVFDLGDPDGAAGTNWDLLTANGNFTLDGELLVNFVGYSPSYGDSWDVIVVNAGDVATYNGSGMFDTLPANIQASLRDDGNGTDILELTYVPEPATLVLLALGGLIAARGRKK